MKVLKKFMHKYKLPHKYHTPTSRIQFMRSLIFKQIYFHSQYSWVCGLSSPETKCTILYQNLTTNMVSKAKHQIFTGMCSYPHTCTVTDWTADISEYLTVSIFKAKSLMQVLLDCFDPEDEKQ